MTGSERQQITAEVRDFSDTLREQATRAKELLSDLIRLVDSNGNFPELFFADSHSEFYSNKARLRREKALLLGYLYGEQGSKRAVILAEDGSIFSTVFRNVYKVSPLDGYGRYKTKSTLASTRYLASGKELAGVDILHWFPTAQTMLLDLINK